MVNKFSATMQGPHNFGKEHNETRAAMLEMQRQSPPLDPSALSKQFST